MATPSTISQHSAVLDPFEVDLPGEVSNIIPFPGSWEPDPEPPAACALCGEAGAAPETGLCHLCAARLPQVGGCGLGLRLVAGLTGGASLPALDHLDACPACRRLFQMLADVAWVADREAAFPAAGEQAA
jgi:hypothetical protein